MTPATDSKNAGEDDNEVLAWVAYLMCVLGAVFYCYEYYLRVAPSVIKPELMQAYNLHQAGIAALVAYYYLAYVPLQIPVGLMMDKYGPRKILTFACLLCALGTYLFAGTNMPLMAKLGRFLVGFGSAFAYVGVLKIANLWLPKRYFAMVAGICTALGMLGAISGEILMVKFVELTGWRSALYSSAFIGFILALVLWAVIRDKSDQEVTIRVRASHHNVTVWSELLAVIATPQLWINGLIGCLTFLPLTVFAEFWAVSYLESLGLTKDIAALGSGLVFLGFGFGGPIWGRLSDVIESRKKPLLVGATIAAIISCGLLSLDGSNLWVLFSLLILLGFFASTQVLVFAIGNDICKPGMNATTLSFTNFLVMLGGMALQPLVGLILDFLKLQSQASDYLVSSAGDYKVALLVMPLGLAIAAVLCIFMRESYHEGNS